MGNKNYSKPKFGLIILITTICILAVFGVAWLLMAFVWPYKFASFVYKAGLNTYAHTLYMRDYKKTNNINSLYMANNLSIKLKSYSSIVSEYELLESHAKYNELITKVNQDNMALNIDVLTKSTLVNEDEYLKNNYVLALVNTGKWSDAMLLASSQIDGITPTLDNQGNYLFGYMVNSKDTSRVELADKANDIYTYFCALADVLESCNYATESEVLMVALCNKMIKVGNNLIAICDDYSVSGIKDNVQLKLQDVNSALSTLLGD